jgi:hypothetical protein
MRERKEDKGGDVEDGEMRGNIERRRREGRKRQ